MWIFSLPHTLTRLEQDFNNKWPVLCTLGSFHINFEKEFYVVNIFPWTNYKQVYAGRAVTTWSVKIESFSQFIVFHVCTKYRDLLSKYGKLLENSIFERFSRRLLFSVHKRECNDQIKFCFYQKYSPSEMFYKKAIRKNLQNY